ncbi:MAG: ornithine cyclodeaminase [Acidobacteria bacterium]|nr:MAG: ornithine cyclodeaminase [Acidobacteriota bacterium]
MLYLTESDVRALLPMRQAIDLMQAAFERLARGEAINQPRRRLILPTGSVLHYMAASDGNYFGAKVYSTNKLSGAHFLFLLYRASDGSPLSLIEANHLGQIRTGAVSGLATKYLARPDAATLGLIGSGFQARSQFEAMLAVRPIRQAKLWSRDPAKRSSFEAVRDAQIVVTATNAKDPVLDADWIAGGTHINAMGSNQANRKELPAELIHRSSRIVVDSLEQARMESGDLLLALDESGWKDSKIVELKDVATTPQPAEWRPDQITIFKSNGLAVEDVICAGYVYERAIESKRGVEVLTPEHAGTRGQPQ